MNIIRIEIKNNNHLSLNKAKIILIRPLYIDNKLDSKKETKFIRVKLPLTMYSWFEDTKKVFNVTYSDIIYGSILDRPRLKDIFIKLINAEELNKSELEFITTFINLAY